MSRARSVLAVLAFVVLSQTAAAGPASAGGPTSVLLVVPGAGQTASLYTGSPEYEQLAGLVGAYDPATSEGKAGGHETGVGVTLTWLIHDVQVWRVDRVYLDAAGGPWIATQATFGDGNIWDAPEVWHAPDKGKELAVLLDGLLDTDSASASAADQPEAAAEQPGTGTETATDTAADATQTVAATETRWGVTGLVGLVGLALGAAMTLLALRKLPFRRPATPDATAARQDDLTDPDFPMTDRLSWRTPAR